jgi:hypothetical protein
MVCTVFPFKLLIKLCRNSDLDPNNGTMTVYKKNQSLEYITSHPEYKLHSEMKIL